MGQGLYRVMCVNALVLLAACGGGGSSSGASSAAPPVMVQVAPLVPTGTYRGTRTSSFMGLRVDDTPREDPFVFTVSGTVPGQQQVRLVFRQWSGTSAIVGPTNSFSLPSGTFILGGDFGRCEGSVTYEGEFSEATSAGSASGSFDCERASGPITFQATFRVSLDGAAKSPVNENLVPTRQSF